MTDQHEQLERLLDPTEAGQIIGYCGRTMQRKALAGEIPHIKLAGGKIRFRPSKLKQYIEAREVVPTVGYTKLHQVAVGQ